jgi:hypothetical protein
MNSAAAQDKATNQPTAPGEQCQQAIHHLDQALDAAPPEVITKVREAQRAMVGLRDQAIDQLRSHPPSTAATHAGTRLDQINMALSCLAGVEYPSGGSHHKLLKQARRALQDLLGEMPQ